jgi:hypothetical protein
MKAHSFAIGYTLFQLLVIIDKLCENIVPRNKKIIEKISMKHDILNIIITIVC